MDENKAWIWNPKVKGSGIIECIPQTGLCPVKCDDCFFQSGRSYLEPLSENLPHVPTFEMADGRIVRVNDGNDSNANRDIVEAVTEKFVDKFYNTSMPFRLGEFPGPVVLTVNPGKKTDVDFHKVDPIPSNLMFVRVRVSAWNVETVVVPAVQYYTERNVPVVLTFMAYYTETIPDGYQYAYEWKKRTLNSYWCMTKEAMDFVTGLFERNPYVYTCGYKGQYACSRCGNCIREYYNAKERLRKND